MSVSVTSEGGQVFIQKWGLSPSINGNYKLVCPSCDMDAELYIKGTREPVGSSIVECESCGSTFKVCQGNVEELDDVTHCEGCRTGDRRICDGMGCPNAHEGVR